MSSMWKLWFSMSPSPAGKFPKRNKSEIWWENAKRKEWGNCTWSKEVKQCMARGRGVQQPRMNPNRNSKRRREGQRNWLMLHLLLGHLYHSLCSFTASAHVSFLLFVCFSPPPPYSLFPHKFLSPFPLSQPPKILSLGKNLYNRKVAAAGVLKDVHWTWLVAAGKEPKNKIKRIKQQSRKRETTTQP